jgi:hypothetical protein
MKITKELILKIELTGEDLENFKSALEDIMAAENASNVGIGFLKREQKTILETILRTITND